MKSNAEKQKPKRTGIKWTEKSEGTRRGNGRIVEEEKPKDFA